MSDSAPFEQQQSAPSSDKWNVLSIVALVISILGFNIIAVILGFIALNQVGKSGERGKGLANAAIIIGLVSIILGFIFGFLFLSGVLAGA
ncbi:MAG TPA: DUF4190 domain-containing protein [Microbacterium sp.]|nr:DUF4190 domain-containing protein [Microbacterium sp.]